MSGEDWQGGGKRKPAAPDFTPISRNRHPCPPPDPTYFRTQVSEGFWELLCSSCLAGTEDTGDAWDEEDTVSERGRLLLKFTPRAELDSKLWASQ